jgi:hypothetical protein
VSAAAGGFAIPSSVIAARIFIAGMPIGILRGWILADASAVGFVGGAAGHGCARLLTARETDRGGGGSDSAILRQRPGTEVAAPEAATWHLTRADCDAGARMARVTGVVPAEAARAVVPTTRDIDAMQQSARRSLPWGT